MAIGPPDQLGFRLPWAASATPRDWHAHPPFRNRTQLFGLTLFAAATIVKERSVCRWLSGLVLLLGIQVCNALTGIVGLGRADRYGRKNTNAQKRNPVRNNPQRQPQHRLGALRHSENHRGRAANNLRQARGWRGCPLERIWRIPRGPQSRTPGAQSEDRRGCDSARADNGCTSAFAGLAKKGRAQLTPGSAGLELYSATNLPIHPRGKQAHRRAPARSALLGTQYLAPSPSEACGRASLLPRIGYPASEEYPAPYPQRWTDHPWRESLSSRARRRHGNRTRGQRRPLSGFGTSGHSACCCRVAAGLCPNPPIRKQGIRRRDRRRTGERRRVGPHRLPGLRQSRHAPLGCKRQHWSEQLLRAIAGGCHYGRTAVVSLRRAVAQPGSAHAWGA